MFITSHLYSTVGVGTHVIVNVRDENGVPSASYSGTVLNHTQQPNGFGKSLNIKTDDGKSVLAEGGNNCQEVYID